MLGGLTVYSIIVFCTEGKSSSKEGQEKRRSVPGSEVFLDQFSSGRGPYKGPKVEMSQLGSRGS